TKCPARRTKQAVPVPISRNTDTSVLNAGSILSEASTRTHNHPEPAAVKLALQMSAPLAAQDSLVRLTRQASLASPRLPTALAAGAQGGPDRPDLFTA